MTPEEYERRPEVKAALKLVRGQPELLRSHGWAGYVNRLMDLLGVPPGSRKYEGGWEMPLEFQYAYKRAVAGWTKNDAFRVVTQASKSKRLSGRQSESGFTIVSGSKPAPLLETLRSIEIWHPKILILGHGDPDEEFLPIESLIASLKAHLSEMGDTEEATWLKSPVFIWGYDTLGFVRVFGPIPGDVQDQPLTLLFSEKDDGALPTGRPPKYALKLPFLRVTDISAAVEDEWYGIIVTFKFTSPRWTSLLAGENPLTQQQLMELIAKQILADPKYIEFLEEDPDYITIMEDTEYEDTVEIPKFDSIKDFSKPPFAYWKISGDDPEGSVVLYKKHEE